MTKSSILGGTLAPSQSDGRDADLLGPSDTLDSERRARRASDADLARQRRRVGAVVAAIDSTTDAAGTGERASADGDAPRDGADILPDRIIENVGADDDPENRRDSSEAGDLTNYEADNNGEHEEA